MGPVSSASGSRKSFHMLSGIVNNRMPADLRNGDVFIFVNKNRNRIKLLRKEPGGLVIYAMMLEMPSQWYKDTLKTTILS